MCKQFDSESDLNSRLSTDQKCPLNLSLYLRPKVIKKTCDNFPYSSRQEGVPTATYLTAPETSNGHENR